MTPLSLAFTAFIIYVLWVKVIKMYLTYWYYKSQNMPVSPFPYPFVGNIPMLLTIKQNENSEGLF